MRQKCFSTSNEAERKKLVFLTLTSQNGWFSDRSVKGKNSWKLAIFVQIENSWWGISSLNAGPRSLHFRLFVMIFGGIFENVIRNITSHLWNHFAGHPEGKGKNFVVFSHQHTFSGISIRISIPPSSLLSSCGCFQAEKKLTSLTQIHLATFN